MVSVSSGFFFFFGKMGEWFRAKAVPMIDTSVPSKDPL